MLNFKEQANQLNYEKVIVMGVVPFKNVIDGNQIDVCNVFIVAPFDESKGAIGFGVAKVNVNTECQIAFANATRAFARDYEANEAEYDKKKLFDPRKFLADGVKAIQASVEERIDVFGSEGKA